MDNSLEQTANYLSRYYEQYVAWKNVTCTINSPNDPIDELHNENQWSYCKKCTKLPLIEDSISDLFQSSTTSFKEFFFQLNSALRPDNFPYLRDLELPWGNLEQRYIFECPKNTEILFKVEKSIFPIKLEQYETFCDRLIVLFFNQTAPFIELLKKVEKDVSCNHAAWESIHACHLYATHKLQLMKQKKLLIQSNLTFLDQLIAKKFATEEMKFLDYNRSTLQKELLTISPNKRSIQKQLEVRSEMIKCLENFSTAEEKITYFKEKIKHLFLLGDINGIPARDEDGDTVFHYAAIIGDTSPFNEIRKKHPNKFLDLCHIPGSGGLTCLHLAFICKQYSLAQELIKMGMDINVEDNQRHTPIHYVVKNNDVEGLKICLSNQFCNLFAKTTYGFTIIHLAAIRGCKDMLLVLLNHKKDTPKFYECDHFGKTALQWAIENQRDEVIRLLGNYPENFKVDHLEGYGKKSIRINQSPVLDAVKAYLKFQQRRIDLLCEEGHCNSFLFNTFYYSGIKKKKEFFHTLSLISSWDRTEKSLSLRDPRIAQDYVNLQDLFEQKINDMIWFQTNLNELIPLGEQRWQHDRLHHFSIVQKLGQDLKLEPIFTPQNIILHLHKEQLIHLLNVWLSIPGAFFEFSLSLKVFKSTTESTIAGHAVGIEILPDRQMAYYDSNIPFELTPFSSPELLSEFIENTVYCDKRLSSSSIEIGYFHVFKFVPKEAKKIPISIEISQSIENQYPFPMEIHKAIYKGDLERLNALVEQSKEINYIDYFGMLPLNLALALDRYEMVKTLLKHPKTYIDVSLLSWVFKTSDPNMMELFFTHPQIPKNLYEYLRDGSLALLKEVIKRGIIDLFEEKSYQLSTFISIKDPRWLEELIEVIPGLDTKNDLVDVFLEKAAKANNITLHDLLLSRIVKTQSN